MSGPGDLVTIVLAREMLDASRLGVRVIAVTSSFSLVAALTAKQLGASLGVATGFGTLDAPARPTVIGGDTALGTSASTVGPLSDTFVALARGFVGVAVSPAQLDGRGAVNLSGIGGTPDRPKVAFPGSRGLPENNVSPSRVWYAFTAHSPRTLVAAVDFVSGPPPPPGAVRPLITPLGVFDLTAGGFRARVLMPDVTPDDVDAATGFSITIPEECGVVADPSADETAALDAVDPHGIRHLEFLPGGEAAQRFQEIAAIESSGR